MTPAAKRARDYRARKALGRIVLRVDLDDVDGPEALVAGGYLDPGKTEDREAIQRATQNLLDQLIAADVASRTDRHA